LGATLRADFDALQNDFEQATEMAADFQRQLAGKSNEFAQLKAIFDRTTQDFVRLQADIAKLREERHRLANEAMRATGLEMQLNQAVAERDKLRAEVRMLRTSPAVSAHPSPVQEEKITRLMTELEAANRRAATPLHADSLGDPKAVAALMRLYRAADELRTIVEAPPSGARPTTFATPKTASQRGITLDEESTDHINISFSG
jgi:chromosome segregation ATPase